MDLSYLVKKIKNAKFSESPFKYIEINNFFNDNDFKEIVSSEEINISASSDLDLFQNLFNNSYKIIKFPGCTVNYREYIDWHKTKNVTAKTNTTCEGYGVVLRLYSAKSSPIEELINFINYDIFIDTISEKFNISNEKCIYDAGLQKYLDGYEISPHPDIRKKALTYMININPDPSSENKDHHTSYMKFNNERKYIKTLWEGNTNVDRCWVPWNLCKTEKKQTKNNSLVIFAPNNDTLHAVKANYDHLKYQRTQLYGNLWHSESATTMTPQWFDYEIKESSNSKLKNTLSRCIPSRIKTAIKRPNKDVNQGARNIY